MEERENRQREVDGESSLLKDKREETHILHSPSIHLLPYLFY